MKGELSRAAKKNTSKAPSTKTAGSSGFHVSTMGNLHSHRRATNPPRTIAGTESTAGTNHHASPALSRNRSFRQTVRVTSSDGDRKKTQVTLTNTKTHVALSQARTVVQLAGATFPSPRRMRSIVR